MTQRKQKNPKPITQKRLMNAAMHYLGRFETSKAHLSQVLERKVRRWSMADPAPHAGLIEETVERCAELDLVNDGRFADMRTRQLLMKGKASHAIGQDLRHKGVPSDVINAALDGIGAQATRQAAIDLARKRRIGPYRGARERQNHKDDPHKVERREIAAFARAGHGYDIARAILQLRDEGAVEVWLEAGDY